MLVRFFRGAQADLAALGLGMLLFSTHTHTHAQTVKLFEQGGPKK